jgi:RHS repeat-associated protein
MWEGGLEPFGRDWNGGQEKGMFLRFPGQWVDEAWDREEFGEALFYNLFRWYDTGIGRYTRPDPLGSSGEPHPFLYAQSNPAQRMDPLGLACTKAGRAAAYVCCDGKGGFKICVASELPHGQSACLKEHEEDHRTWLGDPTNKCNDQCRNPNGTPRAEGECDFQMTMSQYRTMECRGYRLEYRCLGRPAGYSGPGLAARATRRAAIRNLAEKDPFKCNTTDWDRP